MNNMSSKDTEKSHLQQFAERQAQRVSFLQQYLPLGENDLAEILEGAPPIKREKKIALLYDKQQEEKEQKLQEVAHLSDLQVEAQKSRTVFHDSLSGRLKDLEGFVSEPLTTEEETQLNERFRPFEASQEESRRQTETLRNILSGSNDTRQKTRPTKGVWSLLRGEQELPPFLAKRGTKR